MTDPSTPVQIGAHVSATGGLWTAIGRAVEIGAEALQLFPSAPQMWRATKHTPEAYERFRRGREEAGLGEVWLHNSYLVNLAHADAEQREKSFASVVNSLTVAHRAGAQGVVLHTGSHKGAGLEAVLTRVVEGLTRILGEAEGEATLALENSAGQGGVIGARFGELGALLAAVDSPRLGVCFDTCHAFAAGYDVAHAETLGGVMREFDGEIGLDRLAVVHANDSMMELGGRRDRHENIGDGHIGLDGFRALLSEPALRGVTWLLEVPGADGDGPDEENVTRLKRLRDEVQG